MDRRTFLKRAAAGGAALGLGDLVLGGSPAEAATPAYDRTLPAGWTYPVAAGLLPFGHGVMSGDPLADRVLLWTRITIPDARGWDATVVTDPQGIRSVAVRWVIARDAALTQVLGSGTVTTTAARDWTVKVDAGGLPAGTTLFYAFEALGYRSPIGRTRTAPGGAVETMTIAHVACTSWWQDVFNAYGRIADRDDVDVIAHVGDHIYDGSGGHPASRFWADQRVWDQGLDNKDMASLGECRRRYALYYADPQLLRAHASAPFVLMPDQHDDDPQGTLTATQARQVCHEWVAIREVVPDGSGRVVGPSSPSTNVAVPDATAAAFFYRTLPWGSIADIVALDVRRFADRASDAHKVLGDQQWTWLKGALKGSKATHRVVINQVNLGQLRAFNLPAASAFADAFGIDPNAPQGELYTTSWGGHPGERTELFQFLRAEGILDNVVLSGDSHGFFGNDLVEDPQLPAYEPLTGGGTLGAVGVEIVGSTMGRPGGQDVIAEDAYFAANNGSRGAAFDDAATYDSVYRTGALPALLGLENAARAANPHLQYFNWKAEYGYAMVHLRADRAVVECWTTPQREVSTDQTLLAQFSSPVGAPHLGRVLVAAALRGPARPPSLAPRTVALATASTPATPSGTASAGTGGTLPATGGGAVLPVLAGAAVVAGLAARRAVRAAEESTPPDV